MKKEELRKEAERLGIDSEGTVDDLRTRLAAKIRSMSKEEPSATAGPAQEPPKVDILKTISRWGAHFDG